MKFILKLSWSYLEVILKLTVLVSVELFWDHIVAATRQQKDQGYLKGILRKKQMDPCGIELTTSGLLHQHSPDCTSETPWNYRYILCKSFKAKHVFLDLENFFQQLLPIFTLWLLCGTLQPILVSKCPSWQATAHYWPKLPFWEDLTKTGLCATQKERLAFVFQLFVLSGLSLWIMAFENELFTGTCHYCGISSNEHGYRSK